MTTYIKLSTGEYPRHDGDIELDPAGMADYAPVEWVDPPIINFERQRLQVGAPIYVNGAWKTNWIIQAIPDSEQAEKVRKERDRRLSLTDWRFRSDLTPSQEWVDYCQALRDIPQSAGFPWDVQWPMPPDGISPEIKVTPSLTPDNLRF
jgi:hypothetical protein